MSSHDIRTLAQLKALVGEPGPTSLRKEADHLHPVYRRWIEASPFAVLATVGEHGLDTSPRGDPAPLVHIEDAHTLLLPERRGNHRIDTLRNVLADPRIALLFLIPGTGETLRVNGHATISVDPDLLRRFEVQGKPPVCVIRVAVHKVFFQCARAMIRSGLWQPAGAPADVPTAGQMLAALTDDEVGGEPYDRELPQRQRATLY